MFLLFFYVITISTIVQRTFLKILLQEASKAKKLEFVQNGITFIREEKLKLKKKLADVKKYITFSI